MTQEESAGYNSTHKEMDLSTNNENSVPQKTEEKTLKERIMASLMTQEEEEDGHGERDICRVCRLAGNDTLYHPCLCTGSIKYVHQECLLQWLKYSKKDVCELCNHKFSFRPLYRPDMPERLPIWDLLKGVFLIMARFMRLSLTYILVASCWLGLVPLMAARIHRLVFSGLIQSFFSSRVLQLFSTENIALDIARGSLVVTIFLCTFISLVWLREQIMIGGPAHLLHLREEQLEERQPRGVHEEPNTETNLPQPIANQNHENGQGTSTDTNNEQQGPTTSLTAASSEQNAENESLNASQSTTNGQTQNGDNQRPRPLQFYQPVQQALVADPNQPDEHDQPQLQNGEAEAVAEIDPQQQQRFVDELTWQRLLGLDGSFAFIEHVFWTISLNVVFNIIFLYFPAQIGASVLSLFGFGTGSIVYFELPISIMTGLVVILMHSLVIHRIAKIFRLKTLYTAAGMICLMLKVFLLVVIELICFPILCGWWLDICSLPLTGVTLEERIRTFKQYPSSSLFLHWLSGMVYVFYSASFILILRELLRPGVLWFIRNLNDPDFNPIQEMIEQPVQRHFRRLVASMTLFFSIILLVVYVPLRIIKWLCPSTLPYVFSGSADTPLVEYSFELVLLQVIMPTILEYSKAFSMLKRSVRLWCRFVGGLLLLDSYLLPNEKDKLNVGQQQRAHQRQRARERFMRGDQEEQIDLLEALEAIEDDTTDEEAQEPVDNNIEQRENNNENGNDIGNERGEQDGHERENIAETAEEPDALPVVDIPDGGNVNERNEEVLVDQPEVRNDEQMDNNVANANEDNNVANANERLLLQQRLQAQIQQRNLGAQHQALLRFRDTSVSGDYVRPNCFVLRIALLLILVAATAIIISFVFFLIPVTIGRTLLSTMALTNQPVHDLYTIALGLYACWLCIRLALLSREWAHKGWAYMKKVFNSAIWLILRVVAAAFPLLVVIPFMLGVYFQMLVISPLRVAIFQSPLFFPWKEWAMGVVHFKILCASVLMGPDWWMKTAFEQIYADGIWNFRLRDLYINLVFPIMNALSFLIAFPYALSKILLFFVDASREDQVIATRYAYPFLLGSICFCAFLTWQWQKLKLLAQKIRNDKYLIGTQLVNFYRDNTPVTLFENSTTKAVASSSSSAPEQNLQPEVQVENKNVTEQEQPQKIESEV